MTDFDLLLIISISLSSLLFVFIGGNMYRLNKTEKDLKEMKKEMGRLKKGS